MRYTVPFLINKHFIENERKRQKVNILMPREKKSNAGRNPRGY